MYKTQKLIFAVRINVNFAFRRLRSNRTTFLFKNISVQYLLAVTSTTFQTPSSLYYSKKICLFLLVFASPKWLHQYRLWTSEVILLPPCIRDNKTF